MWWGPYFFKEFEPHGSLIGSLLFTKKKNLECFLDFFTLSHTITFCIYCNQMYLTIEIAEDTIYCYTETYLLLSLYLKCQQNGKEKATYRGNLERIICAPMIDIMT